MSVRLQLMHHNTIQSLVVQLNSLSSPIVKFICVKNYSICCLDLSLQKAYQSKNIEKNIRTLKDGIAKKIEVLGPVRCVVLLGCWHTPPKHLITISILVEFKRIVENFNKKWRS